MRAVHKFPLKFSGEYQYRETLKILCPAHVVHAGWQMGQICVWAEVRTEETNEEMEVDILVVGTGVSAIPPYALHVSSFQQDQYVWHVYVVPA